MVDVDVQMCDSESQICSFCVISGVWSGLSFWLQKLQTTCYHLFTKLSSLNMTHSAFYALLFTFLLWKIYQKCFGLKAFLHFFFANITMNDQEKKYFKEEQHSKEVLILNWTEKIYLHFQYFHFSPLFLWVDLFFMSLLIEPAENGELKLFPLISFMQYLNYIFSHWQNR